MLVFQVTYLDKLEKQGLHIIIPNYFCTSAQFQKNPVNMGVKRVQKSLQKSAETKTLLHSKNKFTKLQTNTGNR